MMLLLAHHYVIGTRLKFKDPLLGFVNFQPSVVGKW